MHPLEDKPLFGPGGYRPEHRLSSVIPDDHYAAIGKVADAWADLEFEIDRTIWDLQGTSQPLGACATAQLVSILPKLDAVRSLTKYMGFAESIEKRLKTFSGEIGPLVARRNRVIHDKRVVWYAMGEGEVARFQVSAKGTLKFGPAVETIKELAAFRLEIFGKLETYNDIKGEIYAALPALRRKLQRRQHHIKEVRGRPPSRPKTPK